MSWKSDGEDGVGPTFPFLCCQMKRYTVHPQETGEREMKPPEESLDEYVKRIVGPELRKDGCSIYFSAPSLYTTLTVISIDRFPIGNHIANRSRIPGHCILEYWYAFIITEYVFFTPPAGVMGCGAAEATDLGFFCFVVMNPRVLSANRVERLFLFINFPISLPPPDHFFSSRRCRKEPLLTHWGLTLTFPCRLLTVMVMIKLRRFPLLLRWGFHVFLELELECINI